MQTNLTKLSNGTKTVWMRKEEEEEKNTENLVAMRYNQIPLRTHLRIGNRGKERMSTFYTFIRQLS